MSSAAALFDMRICGSSRASAARAGSREGKTLSVTAITGRATEVAPEFNQDASAQPAHDAGDAVDRHLRAVRNLLRRVQHAEHHGDATLAGERGQVRGR